jgi:hypothetical protein
MGKTDRTILRKPTDTKYRNYYGINLAKEYNDPRQEIMNSHYRTSMKSMGGNTKR